MRIDQYVQGEIEAIKQVLFRILLVNPEVISGICLNLFYIRTPNIKEIENILRASLITSYNAVMSITIDVVGLHICLDASFDYIKCLVRDDLQIMWRKTKIIQKNWRQVISNPEYLMCRKRLLHEYKNLQL